MPPKKSKGQAKQPSKNTDVYLYPSPPSSILSAPSPRSLNVSLALNGHTPSPRDVFSLTVMFDGETICSSTWEDGKEIDIGPLPVDLKDPDLQALVANTPLIFIVRDAVFSSKSKAPADQGPLQRPDNRAGGNVDLWPLVLGEEAVLVKVPLRSVEADNYGEITDLNISVHAITAGEIPEKTQIPLLITMVSAHCLPQSKDGTVYMAAIGLDGSDTATKVIDFGMSLSDKRSPKTVWASASLGGPISYTAYNVPNEDIFIPDDLDVGDTNSCRSMYWHTLNRTIVDPAQLRDRLAAPFFIEVGAVPKYGKPENRGSYMGSVDAAVLLEPGVSGLTTCARLHYYNEDDLPTGARPMLDLPPTSAKIRNMGPVFDEFEHSTYITIRFDLLEPLIPKFKLLTLYEMIGFPHPEGKQTNQDILYIEPPPEGPVVDVRHIRVECGALAVHKELSGLACRGAVPMNQGINRTAANRLLTQTRTMLKNFPPGDCSYIEWQDTVTGQHAAARRAVLHSFAPQPPPLRLSAASSASRCRMAGDTRLADKYIENDLKANDKHPRILLSKALRCLEARQDREAKKYIVKGLTSQTSSRFLLWTYGALEFDQGEDALDAAKAAFRIAVIGDYSNGTAYAIGWAALHALHHYNYKQYAAFVAAKKMRKSYELIKEWKEFLQRWIDTSGEEEVLWTPGAISSYNPMLIASAFFLCLRCYTFSERILKCYEEGCGTRGSRLGLVTKITPDVYYLRAVSWLLRHQIDEALKVVEDGIKRFAPSPVLLQLQATCIRCLHDGWDGACEAALCMAEKSGADPCPNLLLTSAVSGMRENPQKALQRAALAHKEAPSGYTALALGRIYMRLGDPNLAERWAAVSVKCEPYLADGWAFLAVLAMRDQLIEKARAMLRTARQVGPVSKDIEEELRKLMDIVKVEKLSDKMIKDLCLCDYLDPLD